MQGFWPTYRRRIALLAGAITALLLLSLSIGLLYINSEAGKKQLIAWANAYFEDSDNSIRLGAIEGSVFSNFRLASITISDRRGVWLDLQKADVKWSPFALLGGSLDVTDIIVQTLRVRRLPKKTESSEPLPSLSLELPILPFDIKVAAFNAATIEFGGDFVRTQASFRGGGTLKLTSADGILLTAELTDLGRHKDQITVDIAYPGAGQDLSADILVSAPKGGVLATLLGVDKTEDVTAVFKGIGPLDDWSGALKARVGETDIADASLHLTGQTMSIRAQLNAGDYIPDTEAALLGRTATLVFDIEPADIDGLKTLSLELIADTLLLKADGNLSTHDLMAANDINFSLKVVDAKPFNQQFAPARFEPFEVTGILSNISGDPKINATMASVTTAFGANANAIISSQFEAVLKPATIDLAASGTVAEIGGTMFTGLQSLVNPGLSWSLIASRDRTNSDITVDRFLIENPGVSIEIHGKSAAGGNPVQADVKASLADIGELLPGAKGQASFTANLDRSAEGGVHVATIQLNTENIDVGDGKLNELLGATPFVNLKASRQPNGALEIENLVASGQFFTLEGSTRISSDQKIDQSVFHLSVTDLEKLESLKSVSIEGDIGATASLSGPVASPSMVVETGLNQFDIQNFRLRNLTARMNVDNLLAAPIGSLTIMADTSLGDLKAGTDFQFDGAGTLPAAGLDIVLGDYHASGTLTVSATGPTTGVITIATEAAEEQAPAQYGTIEARINLLDTDGYQQIELSGKVDDLTIPLQASQMLRVESATVSTSALFTGPMRGIKGIAELKGLEHQHFQASAARLSLEQKALELAYEMQMQGTQFMPYDLLIRGGVKEVPMGRELRINLEGVTGQIPIRTVAPLEFTFADNGFSLEPFNILLGDGQVSGSMSRPKDRVQMDMLAEQADLGAIAVFFPDIPSAGALTGDITFEKTSDRTEGNFTIALSDISVGGGATLLDPDLTLSMTGEITDKAVSMSGDALLPEIVDARFSANVPIQAGTSSFGFSVMENDPLTGNLTLKGDVGAIWPIFELVNHDLRGTVDAQLQVAGTIESPDINGHANLTGGRYENVQTGFVAADIDLKTAIADRRLVIDQLSANDGATGQIMAEGIIDIHPDLTFDAAATLTVDSARILRRPQLDVTASSRLSFVKNGATTQLSGDITVNNAHVGAVTTGGPRVIELDVREINGSLEKEALATEKAGSHLGPLALNLNFHAPGKLFIRRYGLESEWSSKLNLTGSSYAPILTGSASLVRGVFDFSGKRFELTRGSLSFPNDNRNDPILDISAEHKLADITAILRISGRASTPMLEMSSVPSLPQDEVLSRIFFGTSVASLSPIEAVQLAAAVHALSTGGGSGLIGNVRRSLGIDRLAIDQAENRDYGTTITGGKYLTNNIYVEVTTAPATGETATAVEVGLTKNLSLITRRTLDHDNNLAIRWSWNY